MERIGRQQLGAHAAIELCPHPVSHWVIGNFGEQSFPFLTRPWVVFTQRKPTVGSVLQFKLFLLRFREEVNGTLNLFGFHIKFFGNCLWKRTVCSVPVLHIGFRLEQKWELGFWSCHLEWITPTALFPLLCDRLPRLFLFRVISWPCRLLLSLAPNTARCGWNQTLKKSLLVSFITGFWRDWLLDLLDFDMDGRLHNDLHALHWASLMWRASCSPMFSPNCD